MIYDKTIRRFIVNKEECMKHHNETEIKNAMEVVNGINQFLEDESYREGYRNNIAVDLDIALYILGLDPSDHESLAMRDFLFDQFGFFSIDQADLEDRIGIVDGYLDKWYNESTDNMILEYGCMTSKWMYIYRQNMDESNVIVQLSDDSSKVSSVIKEVTETNEATSC